MKIESLLMCIVCVFTKCNSSGQTPAKSLSIPDSVSVSLNKNQMQIPGTNIFIIDPNNFYFNATTNRLECNDSTYIKIVETPTASYATMHDRFTQLIEKENKNNFKTYYQKEFIFQNNNAIILYGLDKKGTTEQIILLFGDSTSSTMLLSRCAVNDDDNKNKILSSLLSAYESDSAAVDIASIQNYTVDMLDTKFKYNSTTLQMFFYFLNGIGDPGAADQDEITISRRPPMDETLVKENTHLLIETYKNIGVDITNYEQSAVYIDSLNGQEITINGKLKGKKIVIYGMIISNYKASILFQGIAYDNHDKYLQQFKQIAKTVKLK